MDCKCCGGILKGSGKAGYMMCASCGTWRSEPADGEMYTDNYWTHENGRSTILEQQENLRDNAGTWRSRMDMWTAAIGEMRTGKSFEIGYAPGTLMKWMQEKGWDVSGVDPSIDGKYFGDGDEMLWQGDLVIAMDVLEHVDDPMEMLRAAAAMAPTVIIQTPTVMFPGYKMEDRMWIPGEHVHVFTFGGILAMARRAGLLLRGVDIWLPGHEMFILRKEGHGDE